MLSSINLKSKLQAVRKKEVGENVLEWVAKVFKEVDDNLQKTSDNLSKATIVSNNTFNIDKVNVNEVFHINQIQKICIDYRLRFLDTTYFKGDYPTEAILKINQLQRLHNTTLHGFKIMAPSVLFRLKKADDPILFAPMGNNYYYLIHKWGNDLSPYRKLKFWSIKNVENLGMTLVFMSLFLTLVTYNFFFKSEVSFAYGLVLFLFYFKGAVGLSLFYIISLGKNFSQYNWQSKYDKVC